MQIRITMTLAWNCNYRVNNMYVRYVVLSVCKSIYICYDLLWNTWYFPVISSKNRLHYDYKKQSNKKKHNAYTFVWKTRRREKRGVGASEGSLATWLASVPAQRKLNQIPYNHIIKMKIEKLCHTDQKNASNHIHHMGTTYKLHKNV